MPQNLCRICGCKNKLKYSIYPGNNELLQMLYLCVNIKIDENDNLPKHLCEECETGLKFAYKLRKRSEDTNKLLQQGLLIANPLAEHAVDGVTDDRNQIDPQKSIQLTNFKQEENMHFDYDENLEVIETINDDDIQKYFVEEYIENADDKDHIEEYINESVEDIIEDSNRDNLNSVSQIRTVIDVETGNLYVVEENKNDNIEVDESFLKKKHTCDICDKGFQSLRAFDKHCKTHIVDKNEEKLPSNLSNSIEPLESWKSITIFDRRNGKDNYKCTLCGNSTDIQIQHIKHCQIHKNEGSVRYNEIENTLEYFLYDEGEEDAAQDLTEVLQNKSNADSKVYLANNDVDKDADEVEIIEELSVCEGIDLEQLRKKTNGFICEICDQIFARAHALAAHTKIHQVDKVLKKHLTTLKSKCHDIKNGSKSKNLPVKWKSITVLERLKGKLCYKCKVCSKYNKSRYQHIKHCWIHTGEKPFKCDCGKTFCSINGFKLHRETHNNEKNFKCDQCVAVFSYKLSLSIHKRTNHHVLNHKCNYCKKKFSKFLSLQVHQKSCIDKALFECAFCDKKFKNKHEKKNHEIKEHSQESNARLTCECGSKFKKQSDLINHLKGCKQSRRTLSIKKNENKILNKNLTKSLKNKSKYCCEICGKICRNSGAFSIHQNVHGEKKFKCSICYLKFRYRYSLTMHMRTHTGEKPYQCNFCDLRFTMLEALKNHLVEHVANGSIKNEIGSSLLNNETDNDIKNTQENDSNEQETVVSSGEKPFACNLCNKKYLRQKSYLKHMSNHDKKPYECKICGSGFKYPTHFKQHMYIHTDERPYICHICNKGFRSTWNLKVHLRMHTGSKPVSCEICGHNFSRMQALRLHKYQHIKQLVIDPMEAAQDGLQINFSSDRIIKDDFEENNLKEEKCNKNIFSKSDVTRSKNERDNQNSD